jgi:hypothetical protein
MPVARPPGGFRIVVRPEVEEYIGAEITRNFRIQQFWKDILERIKVTALEESHSLPSGNGPPKFSFVAHGAVDFQIPTIQLVFVCSDDTLTVVNALVWTEEDYEDSAYG